MAPDARCLQRRTAPAAPEPRTGPSVCSYSAAKLRARDARSMASAAWGGVGELRRERGARAWGRAAACGWASGPGTGPEKCCGDLRFRRPNRGREPRSRRGAVRWVMSSSPKGQEWPAWPARPRQRPAQSRPREKNPTGLSRSTHLERLDVRGRRRQPVHQFGDWFTEGMPQLGNGSRARGRAPERAGLPSAHFFLPCESGVLLFVACEGEGKVERQRPARERVQRHLRGPPGVGGRRGCRRRGVGRGRERRSGRRRKKHTRLVSHTHPVPRS